MSEFPLDSFNRVTQRELHKPSGWERKGFDTAHGAVSFQGGYLLLVKDVLWVETGARVGVMALAALVGSSVCAVVEL